MAIYHLEAKVISRGTGRSACAASAYMSCSEILNAYDGIRHDYTRKGGLVWEQVFLPEYAPAAWQERSALWNAVEEAEKTKDSRLAREFVVALPIELDKGAWQDLLSDFIRAQFVSDGMCADVAIHDMDGHNPHAHIMLTVRPLTEAGAWQYKTEKEYLCVRNSEERGFTATEFKEARTEGWEKQYPYYVDKKKKEYLPPSEAEARGLERADKHPKSTKYGRQNPISARWNSEEQLLSWREAWADAVNRALERDGHDARIDHRSFAAQGIDEQPTIHEGVTARTMEAKGFVSDRCELNRQIKKDNALLRAIKAQVRKLAEVVRNTIPAIAEAMENLRANMLIFRYQLLHIGTGKTKITQYVCAVKPEINRYTELVGQIKEKVKERKTLLAEKQNTPIYLIPVQRKLSARIAELTEELEELRSEKALVLGRLECADDSGMASVKKGIAAMEADLRKLEKQEQRYTDELDNALRQYAELRAQVKEFNPLVLYDACQALRPDKEKDAVSRIQKAYGEKYRPLLMAESKRDVAELLHEEAEVRSIREQLRRRSGEQSREKQERPRRNQDNWDHAR
ncbi:MAG: MobA/MobL family protein [Clostridia bacterium]|nr:MobA/MobL family protein [Clostridia bacterium]